MVNYLILIASFLTGIFFQTMVPKIYPYLNEKVFGLFSLTVFATGVMVGALIQSQGP
jgi:H+/gluconate symporter-like permease